MKFREDKSEKLHLGRPSREDIAGKIKPRRSSREDKAGIYHSLPALGGPMMATRIPSRSISPLYGYRVGGVRVRVRVRAMVKGKGEGGGGG